MDDKWDRCLEEAASFQTGTQFCRLFIMILLMNDPSDPTGLLARNFYALSHNCRYPLQSCFHIDLPTDDEIRSLTLQKLAHLEKLGKGLQDYNLPLPTVTFDSPNGIPRIIVQELNYDRNLLA